MTTIVPIAPAPTFAPCPGVPAPDRLVSGNPSFLTWEFDASAAPAGGWTGIRSGVWEATPGETRSIKGTTLEFCHILSGRVELMSDGGEVRAFGAGDSFVMKPGLSGIWRTLEMVRKVWVIAA